MHALLIYNSRAHEYATLLREQGYRGPVKACTTVEEAVAAAGEAEILLGAKLPHQLYPHLRRCRWIQSLNAGIEDFVGAPVPDGIQVTRVVGLFGGYIAEYILGYMLAHLLQLRRGLEQQAERRWQRYDTGRLAGKRLGLAGLGSIGSEVTARARALGVEVVGLSRSGRATSLVETVYTQEQATQFCQGLDFLAVTLPLTPETRGLFGDEQLAALSPGALVVNCGRGPVIREEALLQALRSGHLGGAVLDVFAAEPLPVVSPLWSEPGVMVTPHISGPSVPAQVAAYFLRNYGRFVRGEALEGLVESGRGY